VSEVRLDVDEGVATITLSARERRNVITASLARELSVFGEEIEGIRVHGIGFAWDVVPEDRVLSRRRS
jgi:enoyl-CoA hydratase/carnithine racemase